MSSVFSNPNNHVPEVAPDDGWGDDENHTQTGALPPRRTNDEIALIIPDEQGIRIEVRNYSPERREPDDGMGFSVQEIGGAAIRLEQAIPRPSKMVAVKNASQVVLPAFQPRHPRGEGREWGNAKKSGKLWLVVVGVGVACVVIAAMSLLPNLRKKQDSGEKSVYSSVIIEEEEPVEGIEMTEVLVRAEGQAREIFRRYATASDIDEMLPIVRNGTVLRESVVGNWRPVGLDRDWKPENGAVWSVVSAGEIQTGLLEGTYPDFSKYAALFVMENGRLRLDLEATSAYSSATFAELDAGCGDASVVRGYLADGAFHTVDFPESDYRSLSLTSPDGQHTIWIYAKRGTAADGVLAELFDVGDILEKPPNKKHPVTLNLRRPGGNARSNQWLIGEMLHIGWLVP